MKETSSSSTPFLSQKKSDLNETAAALNASVMNNPNSSTAAGLVHRNVKNLQNQSMMKQSNALDASSRQMNNTMNVASSAQGPQTSMGLSHQRTLLPRPIIGPNRTFFDKVLDFLIGEGPNNRFDFFLLYFLTFLFTGNFRLCFYRF